MEEKEQLISAINGSAAIVSKLDVIEDKISAAEENIEKVKPKLIMHIIAVIGAILVPKGVPYTQCGLIIVGIYACAWAYVILTKKKLASLQAEYQTAQNDPSISWVPVDYRDSFSISKIAEYIRNNRADTLRECINMLETEMHQNRVENAALIGALYGK